MTLILLANSLCVCALTTLLSLVFGLAFALWTAGLGARGRRGALALAAVSLAIPPFLLTNAWMVLLGQTGILRRWLPLDLFSLGGTVWMLSLLLWPVTAFLVLGAWHRLEAAHFESEPALRGARLMRWLLLPLARPALELAAAVVAVLALNEFAVPALLQVRVFPAQVWTDFNTTFWARPDGGLNLAAALGLSWPLVAAPLFLLWGLRKKTVLWPNLALPVEARLFRGRLGGGLWFAAGLVVFLVLLCAVAVPVMGLLFEARTWRELGPAFQAGRGAVVGSFVLAAAAASVVLGLAVATWRWRVGTLVWFPFLVPGVLWGIVWVLLLNRPWLSAISQSAAIVILAWSFRYLAVGWTAVRHGMQQADPDLRDAALLEGATRFQVLRHVEWPQVGPQFLAGWYVTYLLCLWDVETLILIMPPGTETLAVRIFNLLHYGHNAQVNALCLLLLGVALLPLLGWWTTRAFGAAPSLSAPGKEPGEPWMPRGGTTLGRTGLVALAFVAGGLTGCKPGDERAAKLDSPTFASVQIIGSRGGGLGQFNKPRSVAVDREDNLYVVDMTGRVQKFSPTGEYLDYWQMPQTELGKPKGMCCDEQGNIVVLEPHYSRVNHFKTDGKLVEQWGRHGTNAGELAFPRSVAVAPNHDLWTSEYGVTERVQRFSAGDRRLLGVFGQFGDGPGQFNRPEGLTVDGLGRVYVADSCNHRVQVLDGEGKFLRAFGRPGGGAGEMSYPYDVRVDRSGRQYVCEFGNSRIQIFGPDDQSLEILGGPGAAPGRFNNPWGMAFDSKGNLYVADAMNHRVQKLMRRVPEGRP